MLSLSDIVNVKVGIGRGVFEAPGATVIGGKKPSFNLEILKLFANGEQGFFYDPNDLSTMYQDAAGTITVTGAGQPVGLIRDKSGRNNRASQTVSASRPIFRQTPTLGNVESVKNGNFDNDITGWLPIGTSTTKNITWNSGALNLHTNTAGTFVANGSLNAPLVQNKTYEVSGNCLAYDSVGGLNSLFFGGGAQSIGFVNGTGLFKFVVTANAAHTLISVGRVSTGKASDSTSRWDNISVKEVIGYRTDQNHIEYDGVDDKLITTLPAQLTGCTVIRSVPNVGTQILTGQTIPATYEDNKDHCGLIVINRALTPSETSAIAAEFNKRAGV